MEIGYSHAMGIPVFSSNKSSDASLNRYMVVAGSPNKAIALFEQRNVPVPSQPASTYDPQSEVAYMAATCGFDKESDEEILSFLDEEIIELKEAVSKNAIDPLEPHGIQEELADCAIYLYHFANQSGINLSDAMKRKVARNIIRWGRRKKVG